MYSSCAQFGFLTVFPGNKTHNAVCVPGSPPAEPLGWLTVVLLAVAACVLLLTSAQLGLHIWQLRSQCMWPRGLSQPGAGRWEHGCLLTVAPLQRPSCCWRCRRRPKTPAAASSPRKSGASDRQRRRGGWETCGCEPGRPPGRRPQPAPPQELPRPQGLCILLWAGPCSPGSRSGCRKVAVTSALDHAVRRPWQGPAGGRERHSHGPLPPLLALMGWGLRTGGCVRGCAVPSTGPGCKGPSINTCPVT